MKLSVIESWNLDEPCFAILKNGKEILKTVRQSEDEPPASKIALDTATRICEIINDFDEFEIERAKYKIAYTELHKKNIDLLQTLHLIKKWCEESGLKSCDIGNPKHMAIYHSLHLAKNELEKAKQL